MDPGGHAGSSLADVNAVRLHFATIIRMLVDMAKRHIQACAVAGFLNIFGDGWTWLVIREAFYGATRFSEFRAQSAEPTAIDAGGRGSSSTRRRW